MGFFWEKREEWFWPFGVKNCLFVQSAEMVGVSLVGCGWDFGKDFFFCLVWGGVRFKEVVNNATRGRLI